MQSAFKATKTAMAEAPESFFLKLLFAVMGARNIRYAVLRNYETLPYSVGGSDLDILVHPDDAVQATEIVFTAIEQAGGVPIGCVQTTGFLKVFALGSFAPDGTQWAWWGLRLDMSFGLTFEGAVSLLDWPCDVKESRNGIVVLPHHLADVLGVLKELLHNDRLPERYLEGGQRAAQNNWEKVTVSLNPMGKAALELFREVLTSPPAPHDLAARCRAIRKALRRHSRGRAPVAYFARRLRFEWSKFRRYLAPSGAVFAVLGVDGSGKSTVVNSIKPVLDSATHNATFVRHLRPGLLPPLARLKGRIEPQDGPVLDPHGSPPSGFFGSLLRLTWLTVDYILGYWLTIRPIIARQPAIVIFDRYAYDMALDPRRFRIGLPGWVAGLFARLAPRPDLIICLHASPEVIAQRKQELPLEETRRQLEALLSFAKSQPNAVLISTDGSKEKATKQALELIKKYFIDRRNRSISAEPINEQRL